MLYKILLSGDGGQGIQLLSHIICTVAFNNDLEVSHIPNYGLEQRGGVSLAFIQVGNEQIYYPKFTRPDLLLVMSNQARERTEEFKHSDTLVFDIKEYEEILKEKKVGVNSFNIFFLGLITKKLVEQSICKKEEVFSLLENKLKSKPMWEENKNAFVLGMNFGA